MEYDVVVVGAGPAGLATAIHLKQLASQSRPRGVGGGAREGLRAGFAHPVGRGDGPARDHRTVRRLEGPRRAAEPAGHRRRRAVPVGTRRDPHTRLAGAAQPAQPRLLRRLAGRRRQVARPAGRGPGRRDLRRLRGRRGAVRRARPRQGRGHRQRRHRQERRAARRLSARHGAARQVHRVRRRARAATSASNCWPGSSSTRAATRKASPSASRSCGRCRPTRPSRAWWCTPPAGR